MKRLLVAGLMTALCVSAALAAEKLDDKSIKLALYGPETYIKAPELPAKDNFIGTAKGLFLSPDIQKNGGAMLIHHMDLPAGVDFGTFKTAIEPQLSQAFGAGYKLVKQEDVQPGGFNGFVLEFACPGDGTKPTPGGTTPHHVRWYFLKDGDSKVIGILYGSQESAWKDLEPKYAASYRSLKRSE